MKLDKVEQAMSEACERVREALQEADASKTPVGCTVAVFAGRTAIVGASGAIDCAALDSKSGPGPIRFELEPGESVEVVPCSAGEGRLDPEAKRMATPNERRVADRWPRFSLAGIAPRSFHDPAGDEDAPQEDGAADDAARMAVAQRVLDTAAELEALIKGRTVKVEQPERPSLADEVFQVAFEVEARVKGEGQVPFTGEKGDARGVFGEWPMTSSLSPSEKEKLEAVMGVVHLRAGQPAPEDEALMLVASGLLQQRVEGGLPQVLGQGEPVYLELFAGASRPHGQAVAIKDAILLHGIHQDVMDMLRQEPELSAKLGWLIARQLAIHSV